MPSGMHRAQPGMDVDNMSMDDVENEEETPGNDEQVLPTPGQLNAGDLSDNSNPEL